MRAIVPLGFCVLVAALAGCGQRQSLMRSETTVGDVQLKNSTGVPSFVGRWAATPRACADHAWMLSGRALLSPTGLSCVFVKLDPASAGYGGDVVCGTGVHSKAGRMTLTLSGQGASQGLTIAGDALRTPAGLVRCPALPAQPLPATGGTPA